MIEHTELGEQGEVSIENQMVSRRQLTLSCWSPVSLKPQKDDEGENKKEMIDSGLSSWDL
jgi:hypothetical protein